jgi:SAM-dependent methyltransferase
LIYQDYDSFADIYNRHWGSYGTRVLAPLDLLGLRDLEAGTRVLDLCCGTGQLAAELGNRGLEVVGIDSSPAMVRHAKRNAPAGEFVVADARDFSLAGPVAMVVSTFDSLNHVMTIDELETVFHHVAAALAPGGRFVFDLNVETGYLARWHGTFKIEGNDELVVGESSYDEAERVGTMKLTWFTRIGDLWERGDVTLTQRCYDTDSVVASLAASGFVDIAAVEAAELASGWDVGRVFFSCVLSDS